MDSRKKSSHKCRILVLEDEYFLADDLRRELQARGAEVVGPTGNCDAAQKVRLANYDAAVINVKLGDQFAWPIADRLMQKKIPFGFSTGYGAAAIPVRFREIKIWQKPCDYSEVAREIIEMCQGSNQSQLCAAA